MFSFLRKLLFIVSIFAIHLHCSDSTKTYRDNGIGYDQGVFDSGSDFNQYDDKLDASNYCEMAVDIYCPYYVRCKRMAVDSIESCKKVFLEVCNEVYEPTYLALAQNNKLYLSKKGFDGCKAHLDAVSCSEQNSDLDGGCADLWRGQAEAGHACAPGIQSLICAEGSRCIVDLSFCGECRATNELSGACQSNLDCSASAFCDELSQQCKARAKIGEICSDQKPCIVGTSCESNKCIAPEIVSLGDECDTMHRCPYFSSCISGKCYQSALLGESCNDYQICASGYCLNGQCVEKKKENAECSAHTECESGRCLQNLCDSLTGYCLENR